MQCEDFQVWEWETRLHELTAASGDQDESKCTDVFWSINAYSKAHISIRTLQSMPSAIGSQCEDVMYIYFSLF